MGKKSKDKKRAKASTSLPAISDSLPNAHPQGRGYWEKCKCPDCRAHRNERVKQSRARKKLAASAPKKPVLSIVGGTKVNPWAPSPTDPPRDTSNDDEWMPPKPDYELVADRANARDAERVEDSVRKDFESIAKERDGTPFLASLRAAALALAKEIDESGGVDLDGKALPGAAQAAGKLLDIVKHLAPAEKDSKSAMAAFMSEMAAPLVPPKPPKVPS